MTQTALAGQTDTHGVSSDDDSVYAAGDGRGTPSEPDRGLVHRVYSHPPPRGLRVNLAALAAVLEKPAVSLLPEEEIQALFPDCETGAMPPFGQLYGMPVYVDKCFPKAGEFAFQAGNHHEVVRMSYAEYERLAGPSVANFCRH